MSVIRIPQRIHEQVWDHLFTREGEHFAYFLARSSESDGKPIFLVEDVILVPDVDVHFSDYDWEVTADGYLPAINAAVRSDRCLIELHNHVLSPPRFSLTDEDGLKEFVPYVHRSLPGRPYGAMVWTEEGTYGEYFQPNGETGIIDSIVVHGDQLRQLVSRNDDGAPLSTSLARQMPWFTPAGQRQISRLKIGIVGLGGTGSHAVQQLAYLGFRDFVLVDDDLVEDTNLNRLVTALPGDIGKAKVSIAEDRIHKVDPGAQVVVIDQDMRSKGALDALIGVDILLGCVDNDGARMILNELAVSYCVPYIDIGVGIDARQGKVAAAGGYVNAVLPDGPCLLCTNSIDQEEARYYLATEAERQFQRERGYVTGMDVAAPAVVSLNGLLVSTAVMELLVYITGARPVVVQHMYDLMGRSRSVPAQWMTPSRTKRVEGCVHCALSGLGDEADVMRYTGRPLA